METTKVLKCGHPDTLSHVLVSSAMTAVAIGMLGRIPAERIKADLIAAIDEMFAELGIDNNKLPKEITDKRTADDYDQITVH